jgi:putative flippase GtrA
MARPSLVGARFLRFLLAGVANTAFGFAAYSALIVAGAPVWMAVLLANVLGIVFNFVSTGAFAFRDTSLRRLPKFVLCYAAVYALNVGLVHIAIAQFAMGKISAQAVITLPMAVLTYVLLKTFVFRTTLETAQLPTPSSSSLTRTPRARDTSI